MTTNEPIIDTVDNSTHITITDLNDPGYGGYPYMDTLRFFNTDTISNSTMEVNSDYLVLADTEGLQEGIWSDYYNEMIDPTGDEITYCDDVGEYRYFDDTYYSEYYDITYTREFVDENGVFCEYIDDNYEYDSWRRDGDYVETSDGETATVEYANEKLVI